ncbi:PAB-dependent poly(A)-specific ribonuclease subunit 3 [Dimargaris verticillata]|uniref:PAN2-PAN3 deadenylation complex subunit PAN3 n=1 Tax=Dimargaris verticillata TaxID=2761393 RepID=A0A9W8B6K4_9FUNG|nr:PAB-dependent poly(A)-specific ribonuclease subunit 3 [Dimargaris verticillata]
MPLQHPNSQLFRIQQSSVPIRLTKPDDVPLSNSPGPPTASTADDPSMLFPPTTSAGKPLSPLNPPFIPGSARKSALTHSSNPESSAELPQPTGVDPKPRLCRNIFIYGSCRYENKGCAFSHQVDKPSAPAGSLSPEKTSKPNPNSPVFTPRKFRKPAPPANDGASPSFRLDATEAQSPSLSAQIVRGDNTADLTDHLGALAMDDANADLSPAEQEGNPEYYLTVPQFHSYPANVVTEARPVVWPTTHVTAMNRLPQLPLQYHLYGPPPSNIANLRPNQRTVHDFFIPDHLREELAAKAAARWELPAFNPSLPAEVNQYHSLCPLPALSHSNFLGLGRLKTSSYKAISSHDGCAYTLYRVEGFRLMNDNAMVAVDRWQAIRHPNVASLYSAFTTTAFGDNSVVFVYDYYPQAVTLKGSYFTNPRAGSNLAPPHNPYYPAQPVDVTHSSGSGDGQSGAFSFPLAEEQLWSILIQLASALHAIHKANLAVHSLDVSRILLTDQNRVCIDQVGVVDFMTFETPIDTIQAQQNDLSCLGKVMTQLACGQIQALTSSPKAMEYIHYHYHPDLKQAILYLLGRMGPGRTVDDLMRLIGSRAYAELDALRTRGDTLQAELSRELENGRLVRLLCKFGFINERPEFDMDPEWSETGDRYLIKLFRDFVFHQVDEHGKPVVDMAHVLSCLNKLDAGSQEKVMLTSRDEQSCLIVSYRDIKRCIEVAFGDLCR